MTSLRLHRLMPLAVLATIGLFAAALGTDVGPNPTTASASCVASPNRSVARAWNEALLSGAELLEAEAAHDNGADVVAVMTPNDSHHALDVLAAVRSTGLVCMLTHNHTGYAMVRQAIARVAAGLLAEIRRVQVEYVQGGKTRAPAAASG